MGPTSPEIDQQIKETREHLDANLSVLEQRAVSRARRVGRVAAVVGVGLVAGVGIGFAVYTLRRRRSPATRLQDAVRGSIRSLPRELSKKLKRRLPTVKLVIADPGGSRAPGGWGSTAKEAATSMAVSAASGLAGRFVGPRETPAA